MTITVRKASHTDTKLKGYYVGQINGVTVCCCRGAKAAMENAKFLASQSPRLVDALTRKAA